MFFVILTETLDFAAPSGRAMEPIQLIFGKVEWDLIHDRVTAQISGGHGDGESSGPARTKMQKNVHA